MFNFTGELFGLNARGTVQNMETKEIYEVLPATYEKFKNLHGKEKAEAIEVFALEMIRDNKESAKEFFRKKNGNPNIVIQMKKIIIVLVITLLIAGCGDPEDTLSINGMYLGMKTTHKMQGLVMDADFTYSYNDVGFDVDGNDCIESMEFYCTYDIKSEILCGLSDINLIYCGEQLKTTKDVIACFGQDYVPDEDEKYESFTFEDDEIIVTVSLLEGEFNGIEVTGK